MLFLSAGIDYVGRCEIANIRGEIVTEKGFVFLIPWDCDSYFYGDSYSVREGDFTVSVVYNKETDVGVKRILAPHTPDELLGMAKKIMLKGGECDFSDEGIEDFKIAYKGSVY